MKNHTFSSDINSSINNDYSNEEILYSKKNNENELFVIERQSFRGEEGRFRFLRFGTDGILGGINLENPQYPIFSYIRNMLDIYRVLKKNAEDFFMIGHGVGSITKAITNQGKKITVAEIEKDILDISKEFFFYNGNEVIIGEGKRILKEMKDKSLDVIFIDVFEGTLIPEQFTTNNFFSITKSKIHNTGIVIMNVLGRIKNDSLVKSLYLNMSSEYTNIKLFSKYDDVNRFQNLIFVLSLTPIPNIELNDIKEVCINV